MSSTPVRNTVTRTITIEAHRQQAFQLLLDEFSTGERFDREAERRQDDELAGVESLRYLFGFARGHRCGASRVVAHVLASLYNGGRFKVDLTDLRILDSQLFGHVLKVLRLDHVPAQEVHQYFPNGGPQFEQMFKAYGLRDHTLAGTDDPVGVQEP